MDGWKKMEGGGSLVARNNTTGAKGKDPSSAPSGLAGGPRAAALARLWTPLLFSLSPFCGKQK